MYLDGTERCLYPVTTADEYKRWCETTSSHLFLPSHRSSSWNSTPMTADICRYCNGIWQQAPKGLLPTLTMTPKCGGLALNHMWHNMHIVAYMSQVLLAADARWHQVSLVRLVHKYLKDLLKRHEVLIYLTVLLIGSIRHYPDLYYGAGRYNVHLMSASTASDIR